MMEVELPHLPRDELNTVIWIHRRCSSLLRRVHGEVRSKSRYVSFFGFVVIGGSLLPLSLWGDQEHGRDCP